MFRDLGQMARNLWDNVRHQPIMTMIGTAIGLLFPIEPIAAWALMALIIMDTVTGYQAAISRGEDVRSGIMFRKASTKLRGYAVFLTIMGIANLATYNPLLVKGAMGLLGAIESFSIMENLYDMGVTQIDPRQIALFELLFRSGNVRRRDRQKLAADQEPMGPTRS